MQLVRLDLLSSFLSGHLEEVGIPNRRVGPVVLVVVPGASR